MIVFDPHHRIDLTGPWAGFSFLGNRLITPEGRELLPEDLAWLSLTACQAQEWRRMMEAARSAPSNAGIRHIPATVVNLRDVVSRRKERSAAAMAGPNAEPSAAVLPVLGPRPRQRV